MGINIKAKRDADRPGAGEQRQAKVAYFYDRLWEQKLTHAYHLLVPGKGNYKLSFHDPVEDKQYENGSHLQQSFLGSAKGK